MFVSLSLISLSLRHNLASFALHQQPSTQPFVLRVCTLLILGRVLLGWWAAVERRWKECPEEQDIPDHFLDPLTWYPAPHPAFHAASERLLVRYCSSRLLIVDHVGSVWHITLTITLILLTLLRLCAALSWRIPSLSPRRGRYHFLCAHFNLVCLGIITFCIAEGPGGGKCWDA